jgi:hypothetical protein
LARRLDPLLSGHLHGAAVSPSKASSSFLKKRTKKLLSIAGGTVLANLDDLLNAISKSFLLLFFKKEVLLFLSAHLSSCPEWIIPWPHLSPACNRPLFTHARGLP